MKVHEQCLPCMINQAVKTANLTNANNREELYKKIFTYMGCLDFSKSTPKIFSHIDTLELTINDADSLLQDIQHAGSILYLGDNCGEICFDKLLIKRIRDINPECQIYFGVRGAAVVNDSTQEDAYFVGMDEYATIISNGDDSLGTVISRTSPQFQEIYQHADVVVAKGQSNYE